MKFVFVSRVLFVAILVGHLSVLIWVLCLILA